MKSLTLSTNVLLYILILIILAGCSESTGSREAVIDFDGETASYEGPEVLTAGEMKVILNNNSEYDLDVLFLKLEDGKTWQDVLDYVGTPGSDVPPPSWVKNGATKIGIPGEPDTNIYNFQNGSYAMVLCRCNEILAPTQIWPVTAFEVKE